MQCKTAFKALLALEEGTSSHGMQVAPRGWKSLGNGLSSRAFRRSQPCRWPELSPARSASSLKNTSVVF